MSFKRVVDTGAGSCQTVAPDGGWGWVIVFAVFVGNCLMDGCIASYGIFYPVLLEAFDSGPALTSMAGSLLVATYQLSCPVVSFLSRKYGCRPVCFVGGCLGATGFILASMAQNIAVFMITFGFIVGIGTGMNFLPGHVITNTYFDRKRGIAGGIVCAGAGFGLFIMAPISQYLISTYGWRGAMVITGGIFMQLCVCAVLMRPLEAQEVSKTDYQVEEKQEDTETLLSKEVANDQKFKTEDLTDKTIHIYNNGLQTPASSGIGSDEDSVAGLSTVFDEGLCSPGKNQINGNGTLPVKRPVHEVGLDRHKSFSEHMLISKNIAKADGLVTRSLQYIPKESRGNLQLIPANSHFLHPMAVTVSKVQNQARLCDSSLTITSIEILSAKTSSSSSSSSQSSECCSSIDVDFSIFRNMNYVLLLMGAVFIQMGQFIPNIFIPEYCNTIGLKPEQVSLILSIIGIVNIFGRLSSGCLANWRRVNALWLCNLGMFMCGVGCVLFPLCTSFAALCVYAVGVGYFIGYFPPLQILIMVEYLGVEKLSSALGILMFAKGPAALFGPPIAGMVYSQTQNYALSIVFAGVLFLLAAGIQSLVPVFNMCSTHNKEPVMEFDLVIDPKDDSSNTEQISE